MDLRYIDSQVERALTGREKPREEYADAVRLYYQLMKETEEASTVSLELREKVEPVLRANDNFLPMQTLLELVRDGNRYLTFSLLNNLGIRDGLTLNDLETLSKRVQDMDARRKELHKKILEYAAKSFGKTYLDVFVDIFAQDYISTEGDGLLSLSTPQNKRCVAYVVLGLIDIPGGPSETSRYYGDEPSGKKDDFGSMLLRNAINRAHASLTRVRQDEWERKMHYVYKSHIARERTEEQDEEVIAEMKKRFSDFISFSGDYFFQTAHGQTIFGKVIEFDLKKIEQEKNPTGKLEEIVQTLKSFVPKRQDNL